ncbi:MAG: Ig-like domain-containing protein [Gemmatimonadaceae bacterium]
MAVLVLALGVTPAACRDKGPVTAEARPDTPALLRVIARSQGEFKPRPATAEDRREALKRQVPIGRRTKASENAGPSDRRLVDSSAGLAAEQATAVGPMQTIRIVPATATLRVGESATLALEALDSAGRRAHVPAARWRPDDPQVVRLDRTGQVTATAPGVATIEAWVGTVRASARVEVLPVVRGRLLALDGSTPAGMQVRFAARGFVDSAIVGADGRFEFRPPSTYADTAELSIRAVAPQSTRYHPMLARLTARETGTELRAVVVPTTWTILSGSYGGATLDVSAEAALRRWRGTAPFARSAAYEGRRTRRVVGWPPEAFPLPVAFVRERSTSSISPADSAAFWACVRRLEQQLGFTAFRPADTSAIGPGRLGVEVVMDPRIPPAAVTWASWGPSGDLNDARVALRTPADFRNASLVAHEMLHALGFGHALEWRSVMTRTASADVTSLTAEDVAYVQLIHRVRAAQAAFGAAIGFLEAAEGERRTRR